MEKLLLFLLLCHSSSAVKHTMKFLFILSSEPTNLPEFVADVLVDDIHVGHCDSSTKEIELKQTWLRLALHKNSEHMQWYKRECYQSLPVFRDTMDQVKRRFNHSGGAHILQWISGCGWDDETREVTAFNQFGYDGEDFISLDMKTLTWTALKEQAVVTKKDWDADRGTIKHVENLIVNICPEWLEKYVKYAKYSVMRTVRPSVSLLQKTPSSPVSCHATGFYPHRALMFWRKNGEELYEDVDQGEILPNHDGSYQMSVDLNVSSVQPEDWGSYDCVFQLFGVKNDIVTKLKKAWIRNNMEKPSNTTVPIISALVPLALVLIALTGFMLYKQKKAKDRSSSKDQPSPPENSFELSERLNPET